MHEFTFLNASTGGSHKCRNPQVGTSDSVYYILYDPSRFQL